MSSTDEIKLGKYANVLMDRQFKRTFGTEQGKRLLQLFLQELIPERTIVDLQYTPQEHVNPDEENKDVRIDVECTDQDGSRFVVEVQTARQAGFYERAIYNASFAIQEQILRGDSAYLFPPVYFIGIMDFVLHEGSDQWLYRYQLREEHSRELMSDRIQYIFLELPNCKKALTPEATLLENFCYTLRNMSSWDERPAALNEEIFDLLLNSTEIANFTAGERKKYIHDMTTKRDIQNQIAYAREEGREEGKGLGREEGRDLGIEQEKEATVRRMRVVGFSVADIAKATGLSLEEIAKLKAS